MLSRRLRHRLCQSCRNDLLTLFENGIGLSPQTRVARRQTHWNYSAASVYKGKATRPFSSRHSLCGSSEDPKSPSYAVSSDADIAAEVYRAQIEAIKEQAHLPRAGDVDEHGEEYTVESLNFIAHSIWEAENAEAPESREASVRETERLGEDPLLKEMEKVDASHLEEGEAPEKTGVDSDMGENDRELDEAESTTQEASQHETEQRSPLDALRDSDASVEEVVRGARQLHGEYLPDGVLSEDESRTYKRLYGDPSEQVPEPAETIDAEEGKKIQELLSQDGQAIAYDVKHKQNGRGKRRSPPTSTEVSLDHTKSMDQRAREVAEQIGGEVQTYDMNEATEEQGADKGHPLSVVGRFQTSPRTVFLPQESFVRPVQKLLSDYSNKHINDTCERLFGGPGLPHSPLTPKIGRTLPQTSVPLDASQSSMGPMEANAYVSVVWPSTYAAITSVLVETRKRLGSQWLRDLMTKDGGPSVLDAGGGGVGVLAWREIMTAEWEALHSSDALPPPAPFGKSTVLTGADNLRHRAASLLENTTFLPRLPDYVHLRDGATLSDDRPASQRKQFDVIIAPHTLWSIAEDWQRKQQVQNLWSLLNPEGGVLILIEKGVPRGFEVIAGARELLLSRYIATADSPTYESKLESSHEEGIVQKGKGVIIAPCTNHAPCPMYPVPGISRGRKDYCSFQQRYIRPPFLQRILGAKDRNHDDVDFSYLSVQKGRDLQDLSTTSKPVVQGSDATLSAFAGYEDTMDPEETAQVNALTFPRVVLPPLKRPGHVTIDLCTPAGKIARWTVTKSFSRAAYRDARKASWGDLWALGAKTSVPRNLHLGGEKSKRGKTPDERMMSKARSIVDEMEEDKQADREIQAELERSEAEDEAALLGDDDDFDADAAEVLKEIEQQKKGGRKSDGAAQGQDVRQTRASRIDLPNNTTSPPIKRPNTHPSRHQTSSTQKPNHANPTTTIDLSSSPPPKRSHNPDTETDTDHLSPSDLASMRDFAAESRVDQLKRFKNARLRERGTSSPKLRLRRGENKFSEPWKEKWREEVEGRKRKARGLGQR